MKRKLIAAVLMMTLVAGVGFADLASEVVGRWNSGTETLEFYGQSIGREVTSDSYLKYTFPSSDQIVLDKGAGDTTQYTVTVSETTLTLTDTNNVTTTYNSETWSLSPCTINLRQLDGAMILYALDHDDMPPMGIPDLVPGYLADLPLCPDGGTYVLSSPPQCSVEGHGIEE